jgi:hypothetical protein
MTEAERETITVPGFKSDHRDGVDLVDTKIVVPSGEQSSRPFIGTGELAASGGGGGVIAFVANSFIENPHWKGFFIVIAPALGIVLMQIYGFFSDELSAWWRARKDEQKRLELLRKAKDGLTEAKIQLSAIESDLKSTDDHKTKARDRVQAFERAVLELNAAGIVVIE